MSNVKHGDAVAVHYKGSLADGTVFDASAENAPIEFVVGSGQVIPGFNNAVIGLAEGESAKVSIAAVDAYGPRQDELIMTMPRDRMPPDIPLEPGTQLAGRTPSGETFPLLITAVTDNEVTVDGNHPLAGQDLTFEITVAKVTPAADA